MLDRRDSRSRSSRPCPPARPIRVEHLDALMRDGALRGYRPHDDRPRVARRPRSRRRCSIEHFENKQDCLLAALDELIDRIEGAICWTGRPLGALVRACASAWRHCCAAFAGDPDGARVVLVECLSAGEAGDRARARGDRKDCSGPRGGALASCGALDADPSHLPPQTSEAIAGGIASICTVASSKDARRNCPGCSPICSTSRCCPISGTSARSRPPWRAPREPETGSRTSRGTRETCRPRWGASRRPDTTRSIYRCRSRAGTGCVWPLKVNGPCWLQAGRGHGVGGFGRVGDVELDQLFDQRLGDRFVGRPAHRRRRVRARAAFEDLQPAVGERAEGARLEVGVGAVGADPFGVDREAFRTQHLHRAQVVQLRTFVVGVAVAEVGLRWRR